MRGASSKLSPLFHQKLFFFSGKLVIFISCNKNKTISVSLPFCYSAVAETAAERRTLSFESGVPVIVYTRAHARKHISEGGKG